MKKLKLKALELGANELLTRAQLKNVLGGSTAGTSFNTGTKCTSGCTYLSGGVTVSGTCSALFLPDPDGHGVVNCVCTDADGPVQMVIKPCAPAS